MAAKNSRGLVEACRGKATAVQSHLRMSTIAGDADTQILVPNCENAYSPEETKAKLFSSRGTCAERRRRPCASGSTWPSARLKHCLPLAELLSSALKCVNTFDLIAIHDKVSY